MKIVIIILLLVNGLYARESMLAVSNSSPKIVQELASSVCSIERNNEGVSCCTGFKISGNEIMTNFHCLACVSNVYAKIVGATPFMMEPSDLIYSIGKAPLEYRKEVINKANLDPEFASFNIKPGQIPRNNLEIVSFLNTYQESFGKINFETYTNNTVLEKTALKINSIVLADNKLDMAILEIENIPIEKKSLTLSQKTVFKNLRLGIIGHPHVGPQPDKKSYDLTQNCKVINTQFNSTNREKVFAHYCDTMPGNSGSPIFDYNSGEVIGLHWGSNDALDVNLAIKMNEIILRYFE